MFVVEFKCWQEIRDIRDEPEHLDEDLGSEKKEQWAEDAHRFLASNKGRVKKPKYQRISAQDFIVAVDNILDVTTGTPLVSYIDTSYAEGSKLEGNRVVDSTQYCDHRVLSLHMDQCAVNVAAIFWMQLYNHMHVVPLWDWFHRMWNDLGLSFRGAGHWPVLTVLIMTMNFAHGPWAGCDFWEKTKGACIRYLDTSGPDDPIFLWHLESILHDKNKQITDS